MAGKHFILLEGFEVYIKFKVEEMLKWRGSRVTRKQNDE